MKPLSTIMFLTLGVTGCADMLGLSDLEFEPRDEAVGSGGAGSTSTGGTDGDSGLQVTTTTEDEPEPAPILEFLDDFPSSWPAGTIFAFEPFTEEPYYFAYEPETKKTSTLQLVEGKDLIGTATWESDYTWTHLRVLPTSTGPMLYGYDSTSGNFSRLTEFEADGSFSQLPSSRAGNIHTNLTFLALDEGNSLFAYDSTTGFYRGIPATTEDDVALRTGYIDSGWSDLVPVVYESQPALFFSQREEGRFALYYLPPGLADEKLELELAFTGSLTEGDQPFSALTTLSTTDVLTYQGDYGTMRVSDLVAPTGRGGGAGYLEEMYSYDLRRNLDWMVGAAFGEVFVVFSFGGGVLDASLPYAQKDDAIIR